MNEFTGERVIPDAVEADLWNEHISRYQFATHFARGKRVLDAGCGTGYGTALLAREAAWATGFDISSEAIEYAARHFSGVDFFVGSAQAFPARSAYFDLVTAFEVIEHVTGWESLIQESARMLRRGGVFLVSTPNKLYYTETRKEVGPNPFHVHEFEFEEFEGALREGFGFVRVLAQNRQEAIVFATGCGERGEAFFGQEGAISDAHFFLAVCAAEPVEIPCFAYMASGGNLLRERERHIALLGEQVNEARLNHLTLLEAHRRLQAEMEKQNAWALRLDAELSASQAEVGAKQAELQTERARVAQLIEERALVRSSKWVKLGRAFGLGPGLDDKPQ